MFCTPLHATATTCVLFLLTTIGVTIFSPASLFVSATISSMCCGDNFCCALRNTGAVKCWGGSSYNVQPTGSGHHALACHGKAGVVLSSSKTIDQCFGTSGYGVDGCTTGDAVVDVSMGFWGGCKILASDNTLSCWGATTGYGYNSYPTSGECTASDCSARSLTLSPPSGTFTTVACGGKRAGHFCCAVATAGGTKCFMAGSESYNPGDVSTTFIYLSCGTNFCCGILADKTVNCWGDLNQADDAGAGGTNIPANPTGTFKSVACGNFAAYFIDTSGTVTAYGRVFSSDVGPVTSGTSTIGISSFASSITWLPTSAGFGHACAGSDSGTVYCWGADYSSQVTDAPTTNVVPAANTNVFPDVDSATTTASTASTTASTTTVSSGGIGSTTTTTVAGGDSSNTATQATVTTTVAAPAAVTGGTSSTTSSQQPSTTTTTAAATTSGVSTAVTSIPAESPISSSDCSPDTVDVLIFNGDSSSSSGCTSIHVETAYGPLFAFLCAFLFLKL